MSNVCLCWPANATERPAHRCLRYWWSIASRLSCSSSRSADTRLAQRSSGKAHELGADMIAMGAYARDPVRRLVLGGLTKYMLANSDLPLLMRH